MPGVGLAAPAHTQGKTHTMKNPLFAAFATLALAAVLLAGTSAAQTPAPKAPAQKSAAAPKATGASAARDTLGRLKSTGQINVAFSGDSLPFSFVDDKRQPAGYSIDLCKRVIAHLGRVVGVPELKVNWLVGTVAERLAMVASGKADLECANTTATVTRMADVDFSSLIFLDGGGLIVKTAAVKQFADLAGKKIGVIAGTTTEARLESVLKARLVNATVVKVKDGNEGIAMLESGSLDAFASDKIKLLGLALQAKDPKALTMLPDDLSIEPLAFALPRGDSSFRLEVNRALTQVYVRGEIEGIYNPWMGSLGRPGGLLAAMYLLNAIPR
jgi:glutamate/aspartate transport system substrate-binding protein